MSNLTVALDAGHGGSDPGAVYGNRREKDDVLRLTRAIGNILEESGINVYYVRTGDEYETPFKKATDANNAGADYFVSLHRNSSENSNQYSGVETLVFRDDGIRATMARNINEQLERVGFKNLGVTERPNLVVLKRTQMPAVLVEVGFINTDADNALFDNNFNAIAQAIADGILQTVYSGASKTSAENEEMMQPDTVCDDNGNCIPPNNMMPDNMMPNNMMPDNMMPGNMMPNNMTPNNMMPDNMMPNANMNRSYFPGNPPMMETRSEIPMNYNDNTYEETAEPLYRVQVGAYRNKENADRILDALLIEGFPAFMINEDGYYKVQVGAFRFLSNAIKMERRLRRFRYNTYIVYN